MQRRPIGFLDSGIGGLSILAEAGALLPAENLVYVADSAHFPYGSRGPEQLCALTSALTRFLLKHDAKLIVVACNTATVHALAHLRRTFPDTPFVGVVPVIKTLAEQSQTGSLGLLSTPNTACSPYLAELIARFAAEKQVVNVPCPGLADLVESGAFAGPRLDTLLHECLAPILAGGADVIGLGCTHYPFVRPQIEHILAGRARVFDSSAAVARRVRGLLHAANALACQEHVRHQVFTTGDLATFARIVPLVLRSHPELLSRATLSACDPFHE